MCVAVGGSPVVCVKNVNGRLEPNIDPDMLPGSLRNRTKSKDHPPSANPSSPQTLSLISISALTLSIWDGIDSHVCTSKCYRSDTWNCVPICWPSWLIP